MSDFFLTHALAALLWQLPWLVAGAAVISRPPVHPGSRVVPARYDRA